MRLPLMLGLSLALVSCSLGNVKNKGTVDANQDELTTDSQRPFLPLLSTYEGLKSLEIWRPTDKTSIWTPKGDANFYAGHGAVIDWEKRTLTYFTKKTMDARIYSEVISLSPEAYESLESALQKMNRVENSEITRPCSTSALESQDLVSLQYEEETLHILNYLKADCQADFVDSLSFQRLFDWLEAASSPPKA